MAKVDKKVARAGKKVTRADKKVTKAEKKVTRKQPNAVQRYFRESVGELRKVSWPSRQEATNLTIVVLIVILAMGAFLGILDFIYTRFFALILGS